MLNNISFNRLFLVLTLCLSVYCHSNIAEFNPQVIAIYTHDTSDFTQGLISEGDFLYESCGLYGQSYLKKYDLKTGILLKQTKLPNQLFAEGIALLPKGEILQLTWKEQVALIYDPETFKVTKTFPYKGEGWGICQDNDLLWMSNGTSRLYARSSLTFEIEKVLDVTIKGKPQQLLNDLICVGEELYANVWGSDKILRIDKSNGKVTGVIHAHQLLTEEEKKQLPLQAVLNGIAYRKKKGTFLLTGKFWPKIFEVSFKEK